MQQELTRLKRGFESMKQELLTRQEESAALRSEVRQLE